MAQAIILRRRKLGKTSTEAIAKLSEGKIAVLRNDAILPFAPLYIRWGCTSNVPAQNVLNTAKAIHTVNNKTEFRKILNNYSLCPKTWFDPLEIIKHYPVIVRPEYHAQGRQLYLCNNLHEVFEAWDRIDSKGYISEYIPKVSEYRVFCGSGRVLCVAQKTPGNPQDIAWNVAKGGRFDNVRWGDWPLSAVSTVACTGLLNLVRC